MPLYEIGTEGQLIGFRRLHGGSGLYEKEIEDLLWGNLDELLGESLFRIARQPTVRGGGIPDIVALDRDARVVVIEVKRDVARDQLAQCLEYAGWARNTSLDELSAHYHGGPASFFSDWQDFTESLTPIVINRSPRLLLVAREFHGRTASALEFLIENGVPVRLVPVTIYEDSRGRRFVDVEGEQDPILITEPLEDAGKVEPTLVNGRRVRLLDLQEAGLLVPGDELVWDRPRVGQSYRAVLTDEGAMRLEDGREFSSPSRAAMDAASLPAYDGWYAWRIPRLEGIRLNEVRMEYVRNRLVADEPISPEIG